MNTFEEIKENLKEKNIDLQFKKENMVHIDATKARGHLQTLVEFVQFADKLEKIAKENKSNIVSISLLNNDRTSFFKNNDFYSVSTSNETLATDDVYMAQRLAYNEVPVKLIDNRFGFALELNWKRDEGGQTTVVRFDNASARKNPISNEEYMMDFKDLDWPVKFTDTRNNSQKESFKENKKTFSR